MNHRIRVHGSTEDLDRDWKRIAFAPLTRAWSRRAYEERQARRQATPTRGQRIRTEYHRRRR